MLSSGDERVGDHSEGIDPDRVGGVTDLGRQVKAGKLAALKEQPTEESLRGSSSARSWPSTSASGLNQTGPGDLAHGERDAHGDDAQDASFRVAGIFRSGMYEYDNTLAYISLENAQRFLGMGSRVTGIEVKTKDIYGVKQIGQELRKSSATLSGPGTGWT